MRVRLLDSQTVNQIAAGEVVERPASVVKELVENAIDAEARRIDVWLESAGKARIRVSDDGIGMGPDDAETALLRHATSKLAHADDLYRVQSLGFRGEALPSIASVSRMSLLTGTGEGPRTRIAIEGGQILAIERLAGPRGTEIDVQDLFFNTPARLKFLKSDTTELGQCYECVARYAIAYPHIAFGLWHNGQDAFRTPGRGDMLEAISEVWGRDAARTLAEVRAEFGGLTLTGYVSPPTVTKPTRSHQYLFVNGRPVRTRTLTAALDQAFRDLTPERRFPIVALNIEVDPELVDVNVSPTKSEVKFQREGMAFEGLRLGIKSALMEHGMMPSALGILQSLAPAGQATTEWPFAQTPEPSPPLAQVALVEAPLPASGIEMPAFQTPTERLPFGDLLTGLKVLGQAMDTFIVAETAKGIVIVDQHVAHERILYEFLCGIKGSSAIEKQPLLVPQTLHMDKRAALLLRERLAEVEAVGFELEPFGGDSFVVRASPAALRQKDPLKVLRDLVDELVDSSLTRKLVPTREQIWITSACKMAVKAGDPLSHAEMEKLIVDLATTENPYMCPHGRPITLTLTTNDLLRRFYRTGH